VVFEWRDYLGLADELAGASTTSYPEAASRAAISRAYFAAYYVGLAYARRRWRWRPPERGADKHQALVQKFRNEGEDAIADKLDTMRHSRNNADYEDTLPNLDFQLQFALAYAHDVVASLAYLGPRSGSRSATACSTAQVASSGWR
jgi:hypothetical protein